MGIYQCPTCAREMEATDADKDKPCEFCKTVKAEAKALKAAVKDKMIRSAKNKAVVVGTQIVNDDLRIAYTINAKKKAKA